MTHHSVLVKYEGDIVDAEEAIAHLLTRYKQNKKWDWYQIGGRWQGMLKLKAGAKGCSGSRSLLDNTPTSTPLGIDIACLKDVDWKATQMFFTRVVVDKRGWHELEESEGVWKARFAERFLSNSTDKTIIAILDCHISR
jgi:hypothetical protein